MKILLFVVFTLVCLLQSPTVQAVVPPPDGGYANFTTAEGENALKHLSSGLGNTGIGAFSLFSVATGNFNTAVGAGSLDLNGGDSNTATGAAALLFNTTGNENTAVGTAALEFNESGTLNTANGAFALFNNLNGSNNTAAGDNAMYFNTAGFGNSAYGDVALNSNTTGNGNTAVGAQALSANTTGSFNIALGFAAAGLLTSGDNNIDIGYNAGISGAESNTIRIGNDTQTATYIGGINGQAIPSGATVLAAATGKLGTMVSSERFKREIKPMNKASETVFALKPVTFRYKKDIDPDGIPQFGLVAEEVEAVNPDLVVHDSGGRPYSVRYDQVNAMLLNEFLKEHREVRELKTTVVQQQKQIEALTAGLQKVSAQMELNKPAPQTALNQPK